MIPTAVIVAGGSGKRMGASQPKQFLLLDEKPILIHTVERFLSWREELRLALVLPSDHFGTWMDLANQYLSPDFISRIELCEGGASRTASVWAGINRLYVTATVPEDTYVGIHDG